MIQLRCGCVKLRFVQERAKAERLVTEPCSECGIVPTWIGEVPDGVARAIRKDPSASAEDYAAAFAFLSADAESERPAAAAGAASLSMPPEPARDEAPLDPIAEGFRLAGWGIGHALESAHDLEPGELIPLLLTVAESGGLQLTRILGADPQPRWEACERDPAVLVCDARVDPSVTPRGRAIVASIRAGGGRASAVLPYEFVAGAGRRLDRLSLPIPPEWASRASALASAFNDGLDEHGEGADLYERLLRDGERAERPAAKRPSSRSPRRRPSKPSKASKPSKPSKSTRRAPAKKATPAVRKRSARGKKPAAKKKRR